MRIVCVATSKIPSVTANSIQVVKACQALEQLGHEVQLFVPGIKPGIEIDYKSLYGLQNPIKVRWFSVRSLMKKYDFAFLALRQAQKMQADIVYTWQMQTALLALLYRIPIIFELHGPPEGKIGPLLFRQFIHSQQQKRLMFISQALLHIIEEDYRYNFLAEDYVISPNGVDLERYRDLPGPAEARAQLGFHQRFTAGYTGHFYQGRGMKVLAELARHFPQLQFIWVGGNPQDVEAWRSRLAGEGLENIVLTGFVENQRLPVYQAASDVLLMPYEKVITGSGGGDSAAYCSPMKMFEYMACKRPVISSDLPVIHEILNESNSVLCPPEDIPSWAEALNRLIQDREMREQLAGQAFQDVQKYTWLARSDRALKNF